MPEPENVEFGTRGSKNTSRKLSAPRNNRGEEFHMPSTTYHNPTLLKPGGVRDTRDRDMKGYAKAITVSNGIQQPAASMGTERNNCSTRCPIRLKTCAVRTGNGWSVGRLVGLRLCWDICKASGAKKSMVMGHSTVGINTTGLLQPSLHPCSENTQL